MAYTSESDTSSEPEMTTDPVLEWYSKIYSRRLDIVGDYAGAELFLIEGDSLLVHCLDDLVDFDAGFQLLHGVWAVESFLRGLISRGCTFHIAFFDQHRELCVPHAASADIREKYHLARAAIIRHLHVNLKLVLPDIEVNVFPSVSSDAFGKYLRETDLFFILCNDGTDPRALRKRNILRKSLNALEDEIHEDQEDELRVKIAFRQLIRWFMNQRYNIVLINGFEWQDTKAIATVLETSRDSENGNGLMISNLAHPFIEPNAQQPDLSIWQSINRNAKSQLTESQFVTLAVLSVLSASNRATPVFCDAFLRHTALISQLSLSDRLLCPADLEKEDKISLQSFCREAFDILRSESWGQSMKAWQCKCDVADLVDGRLLAACIQDESIGINKSYQVLQQAMASLGIGSTTGGAKAKNQLSRQAQVEDPQQAYESYSVLPFSNDVFEPHLAPVQLKVDRVGDPPEATSSNIFREISHWHNSRRPIDPKIREDQIAKSEKRMFFARRRNQFFMAEMTAYAASLTNAVGKVLDPEIITSGAKSEKREESPKPKANAKSNKKGGPTKKEAMLAKIAADKSRKDEATSENFLQSWRSTCNTIEKEQTAVARYEKAKQYLATLNTELKRNALEAEVRLCMLNALISVWISACRNGDKAKVKDIDIAALIYDTLGTFSRLRRPITKTIAICLDRTFSELSLPKLPIPAPEGDRTLAFKFLLMDVSGLSLSLPTGAKQFQLLNCGPYFDRSMDSAPDPRVPFEPDAWQRSVLDEIDARRSLLVIAPTSAGKTFISFYAMKRILESSDEDILVYVAPTKALVNQIAAEVQARFSKSYKYAGNSVWAIHTRDYRINNPTGCQILVTVPHILQIMLLAPSNANSWSKRVKWIIFDEVHCIGQAEDGLIWEQLLLMAPCPIIALSATIGNPEQFSAWLTSTQRAMGNDLKMVQHPHRYSDLRKFVYTSSPLGKNVASEKLSGTDPPTSEFQGLAEHRAFAHLGLDACDSFAFLHPVGSLVNKSRGIPSDLSLEARDCYTLWQSMSKNQNADYPVDKALDPESVLPKIIKKVDIIRWEKSLKAILSEWMADDDSPFEAVLAELGGPSPSTVSDEASQDESEDEEDMEGESMHDAKSVLPLLAKLHEQDALPGIIFNYDRALCERICKTLMAQLEAAESKWKETSPKWHSDLKKWEEYKAVMAKAGKRGPPKLSKKKGASGEEGLTKEDILRDAANNEASPWASFDPEKPVDRFHFADNKKLSRQEFGGYEKELLRREVPEWLIAAFKRGIGVHHAGLNRKYRQVCEMLFRRGYLRVVIATGTLALGINMPCKTVVFSGDSVFLTALNFRQAAGRAGRRGFDNLGNVVFHGISMSKVHRLISSRLPDINGHFPITTTLVLRLFTLLNESKDSPFAVRSINALLSQPRLYLGGEESKMTVLHHLRFSIEYLRRQFLLDSRGTPLNFAGCVSHLYFTENSSFAFHALLKDGYFHRLCAKIGTAQDVVLQEVMLTMAHLFGRRYCRQADQEYVEQVVKRSPSIVFLPAMPADAATILRKHNQSTLDIYSAYVRTFVDQHLEEPDDTLPLTGVKFNGGPDVVSTSSLGSRRPTIVRSPFVALSGHDDNFESIHDLCSTTRSGVFLEEAVVPYVGLYPDESDMPLNAYLYDFYNHGDVEALAKANRIRRGDVWFVLNDFSMVLATIVTSLSNFMNLSTESDLDLTDVRGEGDDEEERQEDRFVPDDSGYETASTASGVSRAAPDKKSLPVQIKKKKKVAESWDDAADEEDLEVEIAEQREKKEAEAREKQEKPAWEEGTGLLNVLKAFKALQDDFNTKFRAMWA